MTETGADFLTDPTSVERVVRLLEDRPVPAVLGIAADERSDLVAWQSQPAESTVMPVAVVMDGATYARWRLSNPTGAGLADALSSEMVQRNIEWRWVPRAARADTVDTCASPPPIPVRADPPSSGQTDVERTEALANYGSNRGDGGRLEEAFRWSTAPLFFPESGLRRIPVPRGTEGDGIRALVDRSWGKWVPTQSQRLDLLAWNDGSSLLEPVDDRGLLASRITTPPGATRTALGRVWVRPFPGTACLYSNVDVRTHSISYRVSEGEPRGRTEVPLGYVSIVPLSDMTSLREAITTAQSGIEISGLKRLKVDVEVAGDFIEQMSGVTETGWAPGGAVALKGSSGASPRRWPLFELALDSGKFRYGTHPDECVWRPDTVRNSAKAVAAVVGYEGSQGGATLHEVRYRGTGGIGYVSGPAELAAGKDVLDSVRVLGVVNEIPRQTVPLIRLRPSGSRVPPPGEPGHRLAVDWLSLEDQDYEPEGAVGFVGPPDGFLAPLYRWQGGGSFDWRLTLGDRPVERGRTWTLQGTVGSAWPPGTRLPGMIDLWEMVSDELVTYSTRPEEFESAGFEARRIVARVRLHRTPGCVPLFRLAQGGDRPWLFTPCRGELAVQGFVEQGIVGFLEPGAPPGDPADRSQLTLPDWATFVDVGDARGSAISGVVSAKPMTNGVTLGERGAAGLLSVGPLHLDERVLGHVSLSPVPFGVPIYAVRNRVSGEVRYTSAPSDDAMDDVEEVAGYAWSWSALQAWPECNATPKGPPTLNPMSAGPRRKGEPEPPMEVAKTSLTSRSVDLARRSGVGRYLPGPVKRTIRRVVR